VLADGAELLGYYPTPKVAGMDSGKQLVYLPDLRVAKWHLCCATAPLYDEDGHANWLAMVIECT